MRKEEREREEGRGSKEEKEGRDREAADLLLPHVEPSCRYNFLYFKFPHTQPHRKWDDSYMLAKYPLRVPKNIASTSN